MPDTDNTIRFHGWETVRLIGRGSFGAVYEIQRSVFGDVERCALKHISIPQNDGEIREMRSEGLDELSITQSFADQAKDIVSEYKLMARLNDCPNVVTCHDIEYIQKDGGYGWDIFIRMELLTPLTDLLSEKLDWPEDETIRLGEEMCTALRACRRLNIVHRDIKPQNIFLNADGRYKLGDFGIARVAEKTSSATARIGTYSYMAPEVYLGERYGSGADIYSLGMVLYWLLNDRRAPFVAVNSAREKEAAQRRRMSGEQIPAPAHGSEALKRIVLKACAFDPKDRYQSAGEMLSELERLSRAAQSAQKPKPAAPEPRREETAPTAKEPDGDATVTGAVWKDAPKPEKAAEEAKEIDENATVTGVVKAIKKDEDATVTGAVKAVKKDEDATVSGPKKAGTAPPAETGRATAAEDITPAATKKARGKKTGVLAAILAVAALVVILIAAKGFGSSKQSAAAIPAPEQSAEPVMETEAAPIPETTPTPEPTPEPEKEHSYGIYLEDLSWTEAMRKCEESGGYLAVINSQEEFDRITALADERGVERMWVGCLRENGELVWVNGEEVDFYIWDDGEPSEIDSGDGAREDYIMLWKRDGRWCLIDSREDPAGEFWGWRGTVGYVCEFD